MWFERCAQLTKYCKVIPRKTSPNLNYSNQYKVNQVRKKKRKIHFEFIIHIALLHYEIFEVKEKIYVYVFVLKNVFRNIKFVKMGDAETGTVHRKITTENVQSSFRFLIHRIDCHKNGVPRNYWWMCIRVDRSCMCLMMLLRCC